MGLLDDAIRDHLELKRRHGADPGEVARLEHEALGPVRRGAAAPAAAVTQERELVLEDDYDVELDEVPADERLDAPPPAPPAAREPEPAPRREPDPEPVASVDQPTQQYSLEELEAAAAAEDEQDEVVPADEEHDPDDVLEETPEFLQETPEHDRLWFEQKPPRDFDF